MDNQIFNQPAATPDSVLPTTAVIVDYAGFWRRFAAAFIDGIINFIITGILGFIVGSDLVVSTSLNLIVGIIYVSIFDSSEMMGTPGKALMGIVVVGENNLQRISFKTAIVRYLLKILSCAVLFVGYLMQLFTKKRQTLHDMISETLVIKKEIGDINYFRAYKENFKRIID